MKSVEFCYWLQGLFEVAEPETLNAKQTDLIRRHLNMVFVHEIDGSYPDHQQGKLNAAHSGQIEGSTSPTGPKPHIGGVRPDGAVMRC